MWEFGVDVLSCWAIGKTVFAVWFAIANLVGNFLFLKITNRFSLRQFLVANVAMTSASYLLVVAMPVGIAAYALVRNVLFNGRCCDPYSWMATALFSALVGVAANLAVLAALKQRATSSSCLWLSVMNLSYVAVAVNRMWAHIIANPPLA